MEYSVFPLRALSLAGAGFAILASALAIEKAAWADDSDGPKAPSSSASIGTGSAWSQPTYAQALDTDYAIASSVPSQKLRSTNFGFSIPCNATLVGYVATVIGKEMWTAVSSAPDPPSTPYARLKLVSGNDLIGGYRAPSTTYLFGTMLATTLPGSDTTVNVPTSATNDLWGTDTMPSPPTPSTVNNSNFGVSLWVDYDCTPNVRVNQVLLTVYYSTPDDRTVRHQSRVSRVVPG